MLAIEWRPDARLDLIEILDFIASHNLTAAIELEALISRALEHLPFHPYLFKQSDRVKGLREIVVHPNYIVLYQVTNSAVIVVSVVHSRREYP
jgi:toxin ParE1/3/4